MSKPKPKQQPAPAVILKRPINNAIVISDLHAGCQLGLCHPDGHAMDEGGWYHPSKLQLKIWAWWEDFWHEWVPSATRGEPYCVIVNGDAVDGVHHQSTTQWSSNLTDQGKAAFKILQPVIDLCDGRYYHIRGTEAHAGKSGAEEERLARELGAKPNEAGQYARYELWLEIGHGLAHVTHHIGNTGTMAYESTAILKELAEAYNDAGRWNNKPPDWIVRSHRHRCCEVRLPSYHVFASTFATAGWQLKTPFAFRIAGARQTQPQIGGSLLRCGDEDLFARHYVHSMDRPKAEVIYG